MPFLNARGYTLDGNFTAQNLFNFQLMIYTPIHSFLVFSPMLFTFHLLDWIEITPINESAKCTEDNFC